LSAEKSLRPNRPRIAGKPDFLFRAFNGLSVRPKLVILHNFFFAVLAVSVYLSLIPLFSDQLSATQKRETKLYTQMFSNGLLLADQGPSEAGMYTIRRGSAADIGLASAGVTFLTTHPKAVWRDSSGALFRRGARPQAYDRLTFLPDFFNRALRQAQWVLFAVLGTIYLLSIIVLEFIIMPRYVYEPLSLMLAADRATQTGDRENELIPERFIMNDEIGHIMHSRNATVTELRRQEDDLAGALQKLEEQDRLVSLGLLSTSVAHELNTPLAVLQGSIEKLLETKQDAHTIDRLARMLRVTLRMRKISEGLVDFARVRKHQTETVFLRPIVNESWSLVGIDEKASALVFSNQVNEQHAVEGNPDRLVQVFVNLLRNALLAVSTDGEIRVESKAIYRGNQDWICCTVLDNGPGIPDHILKSVFEAFVSTRLDSRGTGLGLTVAEGIVTQHGGSIAACNRPEGGAALEVLLPMANGPGKLGALVKEA
jgi:signal transduction histidine kinase